MIIYGNCSRYTSVSVYHSGFTCSNSSVNANVIAHCSIAHSLPGGVEGHFIDDDSGHFRLHGFMMRTIPMHPIISTSTSIVVPPLRQLTCR